MNWSWGFVKPALKYAYTRYDLSIDSTGKEYFAAPLLRQPNSTAVQIAAYLSTALTVACILTVTANGLARATVKL